MFFSDSIHCNDLVTAYIHLVTPFIVCVLTPRFGNHCFKTVL